MQSKKLHLKARDRGLVLEDTSAGSLDFGQHHPSSTRSAAARRLLDD